MMFTATSKQERSSEPLKTIGFSSTLPSAACSRSKEINMVYVGHACGAQSNSSQHAAAPCLPPAACAPHDHCYPGIAVPFSTPNSSDGSLNDMLLPYQYAKLFDDWLSEQDEPLVQQLEPTAQIEQGQIYPTNTSSSDAERERTLPFSDVASANNDKDAMMISSQLPSMPARTRRPPMHKGTASYRENHIHTERQRRQDMTYLFKRLKSVLPSMEHDDFKGDRCTILEHVIDYVQELDKKVQSLVKTKEELMQGEVGHYHRRLAQQAALASVDSISVRPWSHVNIFITLNCPKHRGLWPNLLALLQDTLQLDVQNVALSSTPLFWVHSIYAKVMGEDTEEVCFKVKNTLREFLTSESYSNRAPMQSSKISMS